MPDWGLIIAILTGIAILLATPTTDDRNLKRIPKRRKLP